jgi:methanogenic corrinoid protein MtbC1
MSTFGHRLKKIRKERKLTQKDLAEVLGLAQTTIANYEKNIRFPEQKNLNKIANYFDVSLDYLLARKKENKKCEHLKSVKKDIPLDKLSEDYLRTLLSGDKDIAREIIEEALIMDIPIEQIYLYVIEPALKKLGNLWYLNKVSIPQEHFCSFVTQQIMSAMTIGNNPNKKHRAVAVTVSGDLHEIGLKMVADLLELDGWYVYYLGTNSPTQSIIEAIKYTKAEVLLISATLPIYIDTVSNLVKVIRLSKGCENIKILIGGQAFDDNPSLWKKIGADGYSTNAKEAVNIANKLVT